MGLPQNAAVTNRAVAKANVGRSMIASEATGGFPSRRAETGCQAWSAILIDEAFLGTALLMRRNPRGPQAANDFGEWAVKPCGCAHPYFLERAAWLVTELTAARTGSWYGTLIHCGLATRAVTSGRGSWGHNCGTITGDRFVVLAGRSRLLFMLTAHKQRGRTACSFRNALFGW